MKHRPSKTSFTKLLAADTTGFSADPLVGLLHLETDSGTIDGHEQSCRGAPHGCCR
jgi:hypothetical protein